MAAVVMPLRRIAAGIGPPILQDAIGAKSGVSLRPAQDVNGAAAALGASAMGTKHGKIGGADQAYAARQTSSFRLGCHE